VKRIVAWLARASPWTSVVGRVIGVATALVVLAWIGRTATASAPPVIAVDGVDASAADDAGTIPTLSAAIVTAAPAVDAAAPPPRSRASPADPVYVNIATIDDLRRLPGVGEKRAQAILALRQRVGRFQRVEDLLRVKGIGRGTLRKWRPLVRLDVPEAGAP
jgi:competence protein ComEA